MSETVQQTNTFKVVRFLRTMVFNVVENDFEQFILQPTNIKNQPVTILSTFMQSFRPDQLQMLNAEEQKDQDKLNDLEKKIDMNKIFATIISTANTFGYTSDVEML